MRGGYISQKRPVSTPERALSLALDLAPALTGAGVAAFLAGARDDFFGDLRVVAMVN